MGKEAAQVTLTVTSAVYPEGRTALQTAQVEVETEADVQAAGGISSALHEPHRM